MMKKWMIIGLLMVWMLPVMAQTADDATVRLKKEVSDVVLFLKTSTANFQEKKAVLEARIQSLFDLNLMTKLTIGKTAWEKLSPKQQIIIQEKYQAYLMALYLDRLEQFGNQIVTVGAGTLVSKNKASVPMKIQDGSLVYNMSYSLFFNKEWKIYDFEIEGVSIIRTYRAQFDPFLKEGRFEDLIKQLK